MSRVLALVGAAVVFALVPAVALAQAAKSRLGPDGAPMWNRMFHLADGRTFVTDGALMLDAALAKPKTLPKDILPESTGKVMEKHMAAPLGHEYSVSQLSTGRMPRSYVTPSGVMVSADYIDYLARTLGTGTLRLRVGAELQPMVILADGKAVGLVMALKGPAATPGR